MAKKYKIGDELICLKDINYGGSIIFSAGKYYTISHVGLIYYVIDGVSFQSNLNGEFSFEYCFGTLKEYRKLKLEKLNGNYRNFQSTLQKRI